MKNQNLPAQSDNHVVLIQESDVAAKIAVIRGLPVIADADVADLFDVETLKHSPRYEV